MQHFIKTIIFLSMFTLSLQANSDTSSALSLETTPPAANALSSDQIQPILLPSVSTTAADK